MLQFVGQLIQHWYSTLGYAGIVLAMALESCLIPLPSEIVMPLAGAFTLGVYGAKFNLPGVALAGAIGCVIGSLAAYAIGYYGGRPFIYRYGKYVLVSRTDFERADRWFLRHGGVITFFSRLLPVVRTYISLPAGMAEMPLVPFSLYTFVGSLIWCAVLGFVGQQLGAQYERLSSVFHGLDVVIVGVLVVLAALYIWRHLRHLQRERAEGSEDTLPTHTAPGRRP